MRDLFPEYFTPTPDEFNELWDNSLVSFDANVLLHVLRFKQSSANEIIKVIEDLEGRAWLTNQAAREFLSRRHSVFLDLSTPYNDLSKKLSELSDAFELRVNEVAKKHRDHPSLDFEKVKGDSKKGFGRLQEKLQKSQSRHPTDSHADELVERVSSMFTGKVGPAHSTEQRQAIEKEGRDRYSKSIPPGYMDQNKEDGGFGDLLVWKQLIAKAIAEKKPIIFVTDDTKEDWWRRVNGRTIGPRPELRSEFVRETGQPFYMYSLGSYLTRTKERGADVSASAIREAENEYRRSRRLNLVLSKEHLEKYNALFQQAAKVDDAQVSEAVKHITRNPTLREALLRIRQERDPALNNDTKQSHDIHRYILDLSNKFNEEREIGDESSGSADSSGELS